MNQEQAIQFLPFIIQTDRRLHLHSLDLVDGIFKHTNKCPRCCALYLLGYEKELNIEETK